MEGPIDNESPDLIRAKDINIIKIEDPGQKQKITVILHEMIKDSETHPIQGIVPKEMTKEEIEKATSSLKIFSGVNGYEKWYTENVNPLSKKDKFKLRLSFLGAGAVLATDQGDKDKSSCIILLEPKVKYLLHELKHFADYTVFGKEYVDKTANLPSPIPWRIIQTALSISGPIIGVKYPETGLYISSLALGLLAISLIVESKYRLNTGERRSSKAEEKFLN